MDTLRYSDLVDLFERSTRRHSQRSLFGVKQEGYWRWISYRDFGSDVRALHSALREQGVGPGERVALIASNSPDWATVAFAVFGLGAVLVPIYPFLRHDDWLHILRDSGASWVMCGSGGIAARVLRLGEEMGVDLRVVCFDDRTPPGADSLTALRSRGVGAGALVRPDPQATCTLMYTSGTTGKPKGVELTHHNVASNLSALHQIFPVTDRDVSLCFLPWTHAFGQVVELFGLFSVGASVALAESEQRIMQNLLEVQPTLLFSVPKLFNKLHDELRERVRAGGPLARAVFEDALRNAGERRRMLQQGGAKGWVELKAEVYDRVIFERARRQFGGRIRYAICGGAPLAPEVAGLVDSVGITLYEGYGLTEASPIVTANWPGARKLGSVGKPLSGVRLELDLPVGAGASHGEVIVHGPNVMRGYYRLPDENAAVFTREGGLRTGDLGYVDGDGFLFITGRLKEQYKLDNGRYVVPSPLEAALVCSPMIANAMLHGEGRPHNVALVVPQLDNVRRWARRRSLDLSDAELIHHPAVLSLLEKEIRERSGSFASYEHPRGFLVLDRDFSVEDGTLTHTFKVRRAIVARRYADRIDAIYGVSRGRPHAVDD